MKANKDERHFEVSHESLDILKGRIEEFFGKNGLAAPWFPDHYNWEHFQYHDIPQNIVVFGSFLRSFLESGLWPWSKSRIWCLCESVQRVLVQQMGLQEAQVAVIPRQLLFDQKWPSKTNLAAPLNFVYAGRMSASKGLRLLLEVYKVLDEQSGGACSLKFFGAFDEEYPENFGRRTGEECFKKEILSEIETRGNWTSPPVWGGKVAHDEWLKNIEDEVFLSLSNSYVEDFGVALAQALELGARAIVSEWGGHRDCPEAWSVPAEHLDFGLENKKLLRLKAMLIAELLMSKKLIKMDPIEVQTRPKLPEVITSLDLDKKRREFINKYGLSTLWTLRAGVGFFADTKAGGQFFQKYHDCFVGREVRFERVYLLSDVDTPNENNKEISAVCQHFQEVRANSVHFFSLRYAFRKEVLHYILKAKYVVLAIDEKITQQKAKEQLEAICPAPIEVIL